MGFTAEQRQALTSKLDGRVTRERIQAGQTLRADLSYIERPTGVRLRGLGPGDSLAALRLGGSTAGTVGLWPIRIACAPDTVVCRDGRGSGFGSGSSPGKAHEPMVKRPRIGKQDRIRTQI
jgi:hypothetical protein